MNGLKFLKKILLTVLIVSSASTIADDDKTADAKQAIEKIIKFNALYREKVNSEINVCLSGTVTYMNKQWDDLEKSAVDATTKKQQEEILNKVKAGRPLISLLSEASCLAKFYVEIENAYEGTFLSASDSKVMDEAITDPLTDNKMKEIIGFYTLPHDKWLEKYVTGPVVQIKDDENIKQAFNDPFKNVPTGFIMLERNDKYVKLVESYANVFASIPELGCVLEKEKMIYTCGSKFESPKTPTEIQSQSSSTPPSVTVSDSTILSSAVVEPEKTPTNILTNNGEDLVTQMMEYALIDGGLKNESQIKEIEIQLNNLPKIAKGNRKVARKTNDEALLLNKNNDIDNAVKLLIEANKTDPSDVEISNNLGYLLIKQNNFELAQKTLINTLILSPTRTNAWLSLGDVFANTGNLDRAVACFSNAYRFSKDKEKTRLLMEKFNENETVPLLKQARTLVIEWAKKSYPNELTK